MIRASIRRFIPAPKRLFYFTLGATGLALTGALAVGTSASPRASGALRSLFPPHPAEERFAPATKKTGTETSQAASSLTSLPSSLDFLLAQPGAVTPDTIKKFLNSKDGLNFVKSGGLSLLGGKTSDGSPVALPAEIQRAIFDELKSPDVGNGVPADKVRALVGI